MRTVVTRRLARLVSAALASALGALVVTAQAGARQPASPAGQRTGTPLSAVAAADKADVERAEKAMAALSSKLLSRLSDAMKAGGVVSAVTVCRDEAPAVAEAVGRETGVAVGRTSHRLRNPKNGVPAWASAMVATGEGRPASTAEPRFFDLGSRVAVIKPIGTIEMCTRCHGAPESIDPAVREVLAKAYPDDRATGFRVGDLRGWIWAEVGRSSR